MGSRHGGPVAVNATADSSQVCLLSICWVPTSAGHFTEGWLERVGGQE